MNTDERQIGNIDQFVNSFILQGKLLQVVGEGWGSEPCWTATSHRKDWGATREAKWIREDSRIQHPNMDSKLEFKFLW